MKKMNKYEEILKAMDLLSGMDKEELEFDGFLTTVKKIITDIERKHYPTGINAMFGDKNG
jgi:hypothetical protein